jgi:imidazolonepropionase
MHSKKEYSLVGPFTQLITMDGLKNKGSIKDDALEIISEGGILVLDNIIVEVGLYKELVSKYPEAQLERVEGDQVVMPGFIDAHTHICFAGNRAGDFADRNAGKSYQEIAAAGGGIWSSVNHTRAASQLELVELMKPRLQRLLSNGVTTVEIKSGYGLSLNHELKMLRAIKEVRKYSPVDIVSTCLAAHIVPKDFDGGVDAYLEMVIEEMVPMILKEKLTKRFDIFIEENAYDIDIATAYLASLKKHGFQLTVHGDQFSVGGSKVAVELGALSVDHLEVSGMKEIEMIALSDTIAVALPGASIGIGCAFTPARKLLDAGACLAIASDWNPGSAPMGDLLTQASILASYEKLSTAEIFAAITFRAARALDLHSVGKLTTGYNADFISFPTSDYRNILYHQGMMQVGKVWKGGELQIEVVS